MINFISIFFILYGAIAVVYKVSIGSFWELLWACYWGMLFLGIAGLRRSSYWVMAMLSGLSIPLIVWTVDWVYQAITGLQLFGMSSFAFFQILAIEKIITYEHLILVPMGLALLLLLKPTVNNKSWKAGLGIVTTAILLTYLSPVEENINCFYSGCGLGMYKYPQFLWVIACYSMMFIGYFILNQIIKWQKNK